MPPEVLAKDMEAVKREMAEAGTTKPFFTSLLRNQLPFRQLHYNPVKNRARCGLLLAISANPFTFAAKANP